MEQNTEVAIMQHQSGEVAMLQEKAQIDVQIATAKAFPRNIKRSMENAIAIATLDVETAETCNYSVPRAGKSISGPSVHLAKIIIQVWGNMRTEAKVVDRDENHVTSQAIAFDLESNVAMKVEVKRSIRQNEYVNGQKTGKTVRMSEDMIVVTGNAANSIALRNAIFAVVPKAVTDKVYRAALETITGDISDETKFLKKRKAIFDGFIQSYGVSEAQVLGMVGKASIANITQDDMVTLIGVGRALKDGDTTVEDAFKPAKKSVSEKKADLKEKQELDLEKKKDDISYAEESAALDAELAKESNIQGKIDLP